MDLKVRTVRERLIEVAKHKGTISYSDVARIADLHVRDPTLFRILDDISTHEHKAGRPLLTAVVIRQDKRMPGDGFFKLARRLGLHRVGADDKEYWQRQRDRVYAAWASD